MLFGNRGKKMKKKYIYIVNPPRLKKFLNKIQSIGIPDKFTRNDLVKFGFKSSNDRVIVTIMKALGFISPDGVPTQNWGDYRIEKKAKRVLAEAIRKYYAELYKIYPKAHLENKQTLNDFFKSETGLGDDAISLMINTFYALKELADFEEEKLAPEKEIEEAKREITEEKKLPTLETSSICIGIHIHLPPEAKPEHISKIFESMAKYIPIKRT